MEKQLDIIDKANVFYNPTSSLDEILEAGRYCIVLLYRAAKETQSQKLSDIKDFTFVLERLRFKSFIKATNKKTTVKLSSLVPTVDALDQHIKEVFKQT